MNKLGVITDGISRDLEVALQALDQQGFDCAELQFIGDKEVGDFNKSEIRQIKELLQRYQKQVSCISRHNFAGLSVYETQIGGLNYQRHFEAFQKCIDLAHELDAPLVRIMSFRKEMVLFGRNGAEQWNVAKGAWEKLVELLRPVVEYAQAQQKAIAVETGNGAMITSSVLAKKLIDELGSSWLKVLWDPGNSLYCNEDPLEAYQNLRDGSLAHIHLKDVVVDIPAATIRCCEWGTGSMAAAFAPLAAKLKQDNFQGGISYESVYRPDGGDFVDGFYAAAENFRQLFLPLYQ